MLEAMSVLLAALPLRIDVSVPPREAGADRSTPSMASDMAAMAKILDFLGLIKAKNSISVFKI